MDALDIKLWIPVFVLIIITRSEDLNSMCNKATDINCDHGYKAEGNELLCATDRRTYQNLCYFVKAKCSNQDLAILHFGPCTTETNNDNQTLTTKSITRSTTQLPLDELEILQKVFCSTSKNIPCGNDHKPICASNGQLYQNDCEFAKAGCNRTDRLDILPQSSCMSHIIG
ncbi:hypothetical protein LOTGIDRAFT_157133 [Lottia gigantea]|uniref:Kazal-like domain-containing protein n=1 Tax=Lottia gigantea TaxID=225164 RepID=V4B3N6_LOTGI|nr:hypothetical protein LOTGIDRAFT_157133 [Lottia gigantea]ESP01996.1 hypothetical protein LOTGIDRAFT_157133 [Lottia gigantea]